MLSAQQEVARVFQKRWTGLMEAEDSYWYHDGNPARPYARLTKGKISNLFANCAKVTARLKYLEPLTQNLLQLGSFHHVETPQAFCGSAYGAITLSLELTRQSGAFEAWYTAKGSQPDEMILDRFNFSHEVRTVAVCEDVITTLGTTKATIKAIIKKRDEEGETGTILPYVYCIVNRSGLTEFDGYAIIPLIREDRAKTWDEGCNPFTPDGRELVPPVRAKQNWHALTQAY